MIFLRSSRLSRFFALYLTAAVGGMFLFQAIEPLRALEFAETQPVSEAVLYQAAMDAPEVLSEGKFSEHLTQKPDFRLQPVSRHRAFSGRSCFKPEADREYFSAKRIPCRIEQKNYVPIKLLN